MESNAYRIRHITIYLIYLALFFGLIAVLVIGMLFPPGEYGGSAGYKLLLFHREMSLTSPSIFQYITYQNYVGAAFISAMVFSCIMFLITHLTRSDASGFRNLFFSGAFAILAYSMNLVPIIGLLDYFEPAMRVRIFFSLVAVMACGCLVSSFYFMFGMFSNVIDRSYVRISSFMLILSYSILIVFFDTPLFSAGVAIVIMSTLLFLIYLGYVTLEAIKQDEKFALLAGISSFFLAMGLVCNAIYLMGFAYAELSLVFPLCILAYFIAFAIMLGMLDRDNIRSMRESDQALKEMADREISMLTGQIQPHFVYNTLSSIRTLIKTSPDRAYAMVYDFSKYLRTSIDSMGSARLIPFSQEIENIDAYLNVEMVRFSHRLNVIWKTEATDFYVPPLSIQPLVENAVKHGVCKRAEGGTITISSYEDEDNYIVEIQDDGVGFNPGVVMSASSASGSIGLKNIRVRLERTLRATLWIESEEGVGTSAIVSFPKKTQRIKEDDYEDDIG